VHVLLCIHYYYVHVYDHTSVLTYVCTVLYCTPHLYIGHQDIKYEEFVSYIHERKKEGETLIG
jgi:hypothetical protein